MYFPYLFARRAELLALRDLSPFSSRLAPILEPVVLNPADLARALTQITAGSGSTYVIVNPYVGEFAGSARLAATWRGAVSAQLAEPLVRPTFVVSSGSSATDVSNFVASYPNRDLGVVVRGNGVTPADLVVAINPRTRVFAHRTANPRSYIRALGPTVAIEIADSFVSAERNADFGDPEWFSSGPADYVAEGAFGFADYTVLSSVFRPPGGGPIGAMAVHLSYVDRSDNSIWVEHFISDETRTTHGDLHSKFMESLEKLDARIALSPRRFEASIGLQSYRNQYATTVTTSLANNKRQEIEHHLETVLSAI
jgi:hypothetical protein